MQKPVRYYISQSDDQPVVRSIPVERRVVEPPTVSAEAEARLPETVEPERRRVPRIVGMPGRRGSTLR